MLEPQEEPIDIPNDVFYAPPGTKIRFRGKGGWEHDVFNAVKAGLVAGELYTLKHVSIGGWQSSLCIDEIQGAYNTVMFECMSYDQPYDEWMDTFISYGEEGMGIA